MRPSRLFVWLCVAALMAAIVAISAPWLGADWALAPMGLLIAVLMIDWLFSIRPRALNLNSALEREVFCAESVDLDLTVTARGGRQLPPKLRGKIEWPDGLTGEDEFAFQLVGDRMECALAVHGRRRGQWDIQNLWLCWTSPFGLIDFLPRLDLNKQLAVVPNIRPVTSGEIDLHLRSNHFGARQTPWRGEGSDFHQLTDYVRGMDPRSIDWKHSARHQKMVAKETRAERNHQIILALDNGRLMREEIDGVSRIDHTIHAALALTWAGLQSGDLVGLFAFDERPRLFVPSAGGRQTFSRLRSSMADLDYKSVETNFTLALSHLHQRLSKRSLVVVCSDFVDPMSAELLVEHVAILSRHHVVVFVSLRDPILQELAGTNSAAMDDVARSVSATDLLQERRNVLDHMSSMGIHVIEADPGKVTPQLVSTYLNIKSRGMI